MVVDMRKEATNTVRMATIIHISVRHWGPSASAEIVLPDVSLPRIEIVFPGRHLHRMAAYNGITFNGGHHLMTGGHAPPTISRGGSIKVAVGPPTDIEEDGVASDVCYGQNLVLDEIRYSVNYHVCRM